MKAENIYRRFIHNKSHICIDSRSKNIKGSVFFGLTGTHTNGGNFAKEALKRGAEIAVIDGNVYQDSNKIIQVNNTLQTLQEIAKIHRQKFNIPIIAITGSNGKTTTKNILKYIVSKKYDTCFTKGNLNNHIGVPLTLLSLRSHHELAIIEMGANHLGEIKDLCEICKPTHGLITNIGDAHVGEFGSIKNILKAKGELYKYLKSHKGIIIYNYDDNILRSKINSYKNTIKYKTPIYNPNNSSEVNDKEVWSYYCDPYINLKTPDNIIIKTNIIGKYNIDNIMASIRIAQLMNVSHKQITMQLQSIKLNNNRSQSVLTKSNYIILDAYNANPTSMSLSISNFISINKSLKFPTLQFILGDMNELGENELEYHQNIVTLLVKKNIKNCILVGKIFKQTKYAENYLKIDSIKELQIHLRNNPIKHSSILIKGSRTLQLEKITYLL